MDGGSNTLLQALKADIEQHGGQVRLAAPVSKVVIEAGAVKGIWQGEKFLAFDKVISTVPLPFVPRLMPDLPPEILRTFQALKNIAVVCVIVKLKLLPGRPRHFREYWLWPQLGADGHGVMGAFASRQFLLFLLTGGTAAVVNFASRIVLNQWLSYSSAIIIAYLVGDGFCAGAPVGVHAVQPGLAYVGVLLLAHLGLTVPTLLAWSIYPVAMLAGAASMLPGGFGSAEAVVIALLGAVLGLELWGGRNNSC